MTQNFEKIVRYLRSDATPLSDGNIQDIINARNLMKRASETMANKYKISTRRVYQIWRENYPPIDPREVVSQLYLHAKLFWGPEIAILGKKVEIVFHRRRNYFT